MTLRFRSVVAALALITMLIGVPYAGAAPQSVVPQVVRFSGSLSTAPGPATVTFALYGGEVGGDPLWIETQIVAVDDGGRYSVLLGATRPDGVPAGLFAAGAPRWIGVRVAGEAEQPRVPLASVSYALKAADAETIAGRPLSAFVLAGDKTGTGADGLTYVNPKQLSTAAAVSGPLANSGTANYLGMFTNATDLTSSVLYQAPSTNYLGVGTSSPLGAFHSVAEGTTGPGVWYDTFTNTPGYMPVAFRMARGTKAAPAAIQANDILGGLMVRGYGTTGFGSGIGQIRYQAAENFTDAHMGTYLTMTTTPIGSNLWAERMRITPNGFLGVNTTTPRAGLDVEAADGHTYASFGGNSNGLFMIAASPQIGFNLMYPASPSNWTYATSQYGGYLAFGQDGDGAFSFATAPSGTAGTTYRPDVRMVITNTGRVGIGTLVPSQALDVTGNIRASANVSGASASIAGGVTAGPGYFLDAATNGTGLQGVANSGTNAWGVYGASTAGIGVYGYSSTGMAIYGSASSTGAVAGYFTTVASGKALSATVGSTQVLSVDSGGVHAGPAMTGTPLAHALINSIIGHELDYTHTSNVTAATWTATGICDVTISGVTLDYDTYTVIVSAYGATPEIVGYEIVSGKLRVHVFDKEGAATTRPFTFIIMAL